MVVAELDTVVARMAVKSPEKPVFTGFFELTNIVGGGVECVLHIRFRRYVVSFYKGEGQ